MTAAELAKGLKELDMSPKDMEKVFDLHRVNVWRQLNGKAPVSGEVAATISKWLVLKEITQANTLDEARKIAFANMYAA